MSAEPQSPTDDAPPRYPWTEEELRAVVEDDQGELRRIVDIAARRSGLSPHEAEEFYADVVLKLLDNDYARLRAFSGRSLLRTYLSTVVTNLLADLRNHLWGKYRPSKAAKRLGATAILLDRMIRRDRRTVDEAIETLVTRPDVEESRETLQRLADQLPERIERRTDNGAEELLVALPDDSDTSARQRQRERQLVSSSVLQELHDCFQGLDSDDRLLVRLRWYEGRTVAGVARILGREQSKLYRHYDRVLRQLRRALTVRGVAEQEVLELLRSDESLSGASETAQKHPEVRPRRRVGGSDAESPDAEKTP